MFSKKTHRFSRPLFAASLAAVLVIQTAIPALAEEQGYSEEQYYDEYSEPLVTATPTPIPHTEYYEQAADTDSIYGWVAAPKIEAESAVLMDINTGAILYSKNADKKQYPASITKIMTALLGCENLNPTDTITMSETAAHGITESDSSSIYAETGEQFTVEQVLMAVMLQSANEMTLEVAELTSGSVKKFVEAMNLRARQLGCTNTHFNNPNGLPDEMHYTTANDMAKIAAAAFKNSEFRRYCETTYYEIPATNIMAETRYLLNHHKMMEGGTYAYDGVLGGKTGWTEAAGNTLVTYATRNGMNLVSVVLQSIDGAYSDTQTLLDYGFNNFSEVKVTNKSDSISSKTLPAEKYILKDYEDYSLFSTMSANYVTVPNGTDVNTLQTSSVITKNPAGPPYLTVSYSMGGHQVGTARYYQQSSLADLLLSDDAS